MDVEGPVGFLALALPTHTVEPEVVESVAEVVRNGDARILDLVFLGKDQDGTTTVRDVEDRLDELGLAPLVPDGRALVSDDDLAAIADGLEPGQAAVLLVYEQLWAVRVTRAVARAGGDVALHAYLPPDVVSAALAAATVTAR